MKFPDTYYCYAFIFYFLGDSVASIKISLLIINFCSAYFIYRIARIWYNKQIGKLSSGIFLIFCSCYSAQGWTANAEHFVVFFGMMGILFSSLFFSKNKLFYIFLAGFFLACATICKQQGILYAIFPVIQLILSKTLFHRSSISAIHFFKTLAV